jgi:phosphoribosylformylglycinamidine synthase
MSKPRVLILRAPGSNCDAETEHAFALAGGSTERWHVNRVLEDSSRLNEFQVLCVPGGFSYGDDIAAGRILGNQFQHHLADVLLTFRDSGKLIIGICNGFQVLLKTNLLAAADEHGPTATLTFNDSAKFEARWVQLSVDPGKCVFLAGIDYMELRIAHGEGKFVTRDDSIYKRMEGAGQLVLRYAASQQPPEQSEIQIPESETAPRVPYPANPNGAMGDVAGICDATGRVFGLMPHPEGFVDHTQHPQWTRRPYQEAGVGLRIFQNAVRYFM